jgi:hypothetical protein
VYVKPIQKRVIGARCPRCGGGADGGTGIGTEAYPEVEAGDIALCVYCGSFNRYLADLQLREMTVEEIRELEGNPGMAQLAELAAGFALKWRKENL